MNVVLVMALVVGCDQQTSDAPEPIHIVIHDAATVQYYTTSTPPGDPIVVKNSALLNDLDDLMGQATRTRIDDLPDEIKARPRGERIILIHSSDFVTSISIDGVHWYHMNGRSGEIVHMTNEDFPGFCERLIELSDR